MRPLGTFRTRREAVAAIAMFSPMSPPRPECAELTVAVAGEQWATRGGHRPSTRARDRQVLDHDILPVLGSTRLAALSAADVRPG